MNLRSACAVPSLGPIVIVLFVALVIAPTTGALEAPEQKVALQEKQFFKDDLRISSDNVRVAVEGMRQRSGDAALDRFFRDHGANFTFYMDPRSGVLSNLVGPVPLIPGPGAGNTVTLDDVSAALGYSLVELDSLAVGELVRQFVIDNGDLMGLDAHQLGPTRAVRVNDQLWHVSMPQVVDGIAVRHGRLAATISHGNLVLLGAESWGNVDLDTQPRITADQASAIGFLYADGRRSEDKLWRKPTLEIVPFAPPEHQAGEAFAGPVGQGYGHRLVWAFGFRRQPDPQRWELLVDAHTGELVAFEDTNHYATEQIVGGVYPLTSTEICPSNDTCGTMQSAYPMPFADTGQPAPNDYTNSAGLYEYDGGTATTQFQGRYVRVSDTCGSFNESTTDGALDLGGLNGDHDCTSSGASPGNTPASRACFYELNKLIELARGWLPNNTWLQSQLPATVNINDTCNAYYDYYSVNFFKSGGGCRNTGEIAAVFDHEWGHGMDDNDSGGSMSSSSEAYADIASIYRLHASCVGYGFWHTYDTGCGQTSDGTGYNGNESRVGTHCDLDCSGVRDADWDMHEDHTPDTPQNFSCVHCTSGSGPCGRQVHCDAAPSRQAAWDFVARDLQAVPFRYDSNTAFIVGNRLFYQGSGNIGAWHACTCPSTANGCGAANAYMQWLAVDDDNGNLNDGTPHMTALYAAFDRHNIACDTPTPTNSGCAGGPDTAPALTISVGSNQIGLEWTAVAGATRYRVFRTEGHAGCDLGKALIAEVMGTSYDDLDVANGREYGYVVQAVGVSDSCFGPVSTCEMVTPLPCAGSVWLDRGIYNCSDTLTVSIVDSDLVGMGTYELEARSTTESNPETVTVIETPINSGQFTGTLSTTDTPPVNGDGALSVTDGGTITVKYTDLSYCGTPNVAIEKNATVDCVAPIISFVQAVGITGSTADIIWQTNEIADSGVVYDLASPPTAGHAADPDPVTSHLVRLTGLGECRDYYYYVSSTDPAANSSVDDNAGGYYTFETGRNVNPTYPTLDPPIAIPDDSPVGAESTIVVTDDKEILDVDVTVNVTHTYDGDLELSLIGPDGTEVVLSDRRGGSGENFTDTTFDDEASTPISGGSAPFTGSFRPDEPLTAFDGKVAAGTWRFRVEDHAGWDVGTIDSWSITFTYPAQACGPHMKYDSYVVSDYCGGTGMGAGNQIIDPGEDIVLRVVLHNDGSDPLTGVTARLATSTPGVTVTGDTGTYPDIMPGESSSGHLISPYTLTVGTGVACGTPIDFRVETRCNEGSWTDSFTIPVGPPGSPTDCANCLIAAPGAVNDLVWMPASTTGLEWAATPGAKFYNVYRGLGSDLASLLDDSVDSCREVITMTSSTGEVLVDVPAPGAMYWYLIRAATAGGEGPAGESMSGPRVQNSSGPCP
jgi:subtilisin-like proprotein convertase family protein